jgi:hypothetical protein
MIYNYFKSTQNEMFNTILLTSELLTITVYQYYHSLNKLIYNGTCLIRHTKGPGKCVGLYRMSEYSGLIQLEP